MTFHPLDKLLREGRESADEILRTVYGVDLEKALDPNDPDDYMTISRHLARALYNVAKDVEVAALRLALQTLDVDWKNLTSNQQAKVIQAANDALKGVPQQVLPSMEITFRASGEKVFTGAKKSMVRDFDLKIDATFTTPDKDAVDWMTGQQSLFIRDNYGQRLTAASAEARQIVASGMERGLGSEDISKELAADLTAKTVDRTPSYLRVVTDAFVGRARTYSNLVSMKEAGIQKYEFVAVLDEVTTDICRMMNGRVFYTRDALAAYDRTSKLKNPEKIKDEMPWARVGKDSEGNKFLYVQYTDGTRHHVADITRSGVGTADDVGVGSPGTELEFAL